MVRLIPEEPAFATPSERQVWQRLRVGLPPNRILMANVRLTDEDKDHEADLVVLIPESGIVVLVIKGGSVWHDEGGWWIRRGDVDEQCWPVDQAPRLQARPAAVRRAGPALGRPRTRRVGPRRGEARTYRNAYVASLPSGQDWLVAEIAARGADSDMLSRGATGLGVVGVGDRPDRYRRVDAPAPHFSTCR